MDKGTNKKGGWKIRPFMFYLLMAPLAFADCEGALSVMTFTAELVLVEVVHFHAGPALFIFKDTCVAVGAFEHGCMHLVAEYRG